MNRRQFDIRRTEEVCFLALMILSLIAVVGTSLVIIGSILIRGIPSLSLSMIIETPKGGYYLGSQGGIANAILGSLLLAAGSTTLAVIAALPIVIFMNVYSHRDSRFVSFVRLMMDVLWGIPSIVFGIVGFLIMLSCGLHASLGAAMLTVALLELPIAVRAMDEVMRMVPHELGEAAASLGSTKLETAFSVILRQTRPGVVVAVLLAFGRGIGDTASVLFTAGFTDRLPTSLSEPAATLPLAIFFQLGTPFPEVQGRAYAAAALLTVIVLAISVASRIIARRFARHVVH